jgi:hypothetical protein
VKAAASGQRAEVEGEDVRFGVLLEDVGVQVNGFDPGFYGAHRFRLICGSRLGSWQRISLILQRFFVSCFGSFSGHWMTRKLIPKVSSRPTSHKDPFVDEVCQVSLRGHITCAGECFVFLPGDSLRFLERP